MKSLCILLVSIVFVQSGCKKRQAPPDNEIIASASSERLKTYLPKPPHTGLLQITCINSYNDLIKVLGTNLVNVKAAMLANGAIIQPGTDLQAITYEATQQNQPNSLFGSKLSIIWRYPGGNWQLNTSEVWSLGCVYQVVGEPPYTNLLKGGNIIQINTCFFWSTDSFTGERIDYLVTD